MEIKRAAPGFWRLEQSTHARTHMLQWSRVKLLKTKLPDTKKEKRTTTAHANHCLHPQACNPASQAASQSTVALAERPPPPHLLTYLTVCPPRSHRIRACPCCRHRIASPSIPDGPLFGPALALALDHCRSLSSASCLSPLAQPPLLLRALPVKKRSLQEASLSACVRSQWPATTVSCSVAASAWEAFPAHRDRWTLLHTRRQDEHQGLASSRISPVHPKTPRCCHLPTLSSLPTNPPPRGTSAPCRGPPLDTLTPSRALSLSLCGPSEEQECLSTKGLLILRPRTMRAHRPPSQTTPTRLPLGCRPPSNLLSPGRHTLRFPPTCPTRPSHASSAGPQMLPTPSSTRWLVR